MSILIDSAHAITPSVLKTAGVSAIGRYLGWDGEPGYQNTNKNLTSSEAMGYLGNDIDIFLAFEYTADAAAHGATQGSADGKLASKQFSERGIPAGVCSYFAVDFDIPDYVPALPDTPNNARAKLGPVGNYFAAINSLKPNYVVGAYGPYYAIKRLFDAGLIKLGWQTIAWSGGQVDPRIAILQVVSTSPIIATDVDIREHVSQIPDYGQWSRHNVPANPGGVPLVQQGVVVSVTTHGVAHVTTTDGGQNWKYGGTQAGSPLVQKGYVVSFTTEGMAHVTTKDGGLTWQYGSWPAS